MSSRRLIFAAVRMLCSNGVRTLLFIICLISRFTSTLFVILPLFDCRISSLTILSVQIIFVNLYSIIFVKIFCNKLSAFNHTISMIHVYLKKNEIISTLTIMNTIFYYLQNARISNFSIQTMYDTSL
jgi:hypothetical protein